MDTPYNFDHMDNRIVYVKTVDVADLPDEVQAEVGDLTQLYSVHTVDGEQLALVADRRMAFTLARQHDYAPVAVH
ncbi:DUF1150 family protein [Sedimentitalea nanhaiensis]|uniref:DUF1150 family protein n=1 Tax=Sedimentitalea nanhaiensis TaxID=999627 RepID=A0A1I7CFU3_9RHOB|nr:DUF1150 family protein [Sedimentitalea nanhaiensis]SFT98252.1 hypothetical protein SAMN05216236_11671 [Sedimentitalea nanhaiensis]